jgi:hypothetical protein
MSQLNIGDKFNYRTDQNITVELKALANDNQPVKGVRFDIYTDYPENRGSLILSGVTGEDGFFRSAYPFPVILTRVIVTTAYIGLPHELEIELSNGKISGTFGGRSMVMKSGGKGITKASNIDFYYMGTFNSQGVPNYLEPVNEVIDPAFLADINNSFPESVPINPAYLDLSNEHDFKLTEACDVWIAFVSEGAGYKNTLGYYAYDLIIDRERYLVIKSGKEINLSKKEFELLVFLSSRTGKVFSRDDIFANVWGSDVVVGERTIDVHIRKLREKIGSELIKTYKGIGYCFG